MKQDKQFSVDEILAEYTADAISDDREQVDVDALLKDILYSDLPQERPAEPKPEKIEPESDDSTREVSGFEAEQESEKEPRAESERESGDTDAQSAEDNADEYNIDVEKFRRNKKYCEQEDDELYEELPELTDEQTSEAVKRQLRTANRAVTLTTLTALVAAAVEGLNMFPAYTPDFLSRTNAPVIYCAVSLALLLLAVLINAKTVFGGLKSVFTMRPDKNSLAAAASAACVIQGILLVCMPALLSDVNVHMYSAIAVIGLMFNAYGNKSLAASTAESYKVVSSKYRKYGVQIMDEEEAMPYVKGLLTDYPTLLYNKHTGGVKHFYSRATDVDQADVVSRALAPMTLIMAVILSAAVGAATGNPGAAITVFAAVPGICVPFSYLLAAAVPRRKVSKRLLRVGAAVIGAGDAENYSYANAVVLDAETLFPEETITLYGIKTFGSARIDDAILDAASVACEGKSILTDMFMQIISGKRELLRPAQNLKFEDGLGLSAWVNNKRILIGTRELMLNYGVDVPSKDYETRYIDEGNELVYLSAAGELAAVFVVGLTAAPEVTHALRMLEYRDFSIVVNSSDAIITVEKLEKLFDISREMIKILPARLKEHCAQACGYADAADTSVVNNGTVYSAAASVFEAKKLKSTLMLTLVIQLASAVAGLAIVAVFTFVRDFSQLTPYMVFVFQLMWLVLSMLIAKLK